MKRICTVVCLLLLAVACAPTVTPEKTPEYYFQEGEKQFEKGHYEEAIKSWEKVRESFKSPEITALAELRIADAYYQAEQFVESAAAYEDFLKQHPNHPQTPEVLYRLGMSYYNQILSKDRDQTATQSALVTFESLRNRYPQHPLSAKVMPLIQKALDRLADHELYVSRFYLRTDSPRAALNRLVKIPTDYPDFSRLDEVFFYLGKAYQAVGEPQKANETFSLLVKKFPDSEYTSEAKEILREK